MVESWRSMMPATDAAIVSALAPGTVAVQRSQNGNFVFVVKDGAVKQTPVKVDRTFQGYSSISEGLSGGESVVTDGQLLLSDGTRVEPRAKKAGA